LLKKLAVGSYALSHLFYTVFHSVTNEKNLVNLENPAILSKKKLSAAKPIQPFNGIVFIGGLKTHPPKSYNPKNTI
jgi:hypothetical protein